MRRDEAELPEPGNGNHDRLDITRVLIELWPIVNALDATVPQYTGTTDWTMGYLFDELANQGETQQGSRHPTYDRRSRTVEIAESLFQNGRSTVSTEEIASALRKEGDTVKGLVVAVGNILNRAGWRRIRRGWYEKQTVAEAAA